MDSGKIIERVKGILTTPKTEWPMAAAEPATVSSLYAGYIAIVVALPTIAGFIKSSLIGTSMFGITVRTPVGMGIVGMLVHYALTLALVYVMALIVNALAPSFGGQKDMVQALKAVAYAWTASWIAGIAVIVPWLGWLIAIAGAVYAIYLLYLGLPYTMKCPPEKAGGYTAVSIIIAIVLSWIVALIVGGVIGTAAMSGAAMGGLHVTGSQGDSVTVDGNSALGKLAAMGQRDCPEQPRPGKRRNPEPPPRPARHHARYHGHAQPRPHEPQYRVHLPALHREVRLEARGAARGDGQFAQVVAVPEHHQALALEVGDADRAPAPAGSGCLGGRHHHQVLTQDLHGGQRR